MMKEISNIVILTGAGIAAESGLATFRDADGLWEGRRVEDQATAPLTLAKRMSANDPLQTFPCVVGKIRILPT